MNQPRRHANRAVLLPGAGARSRRRGPLQAAGPSPPGEPVPGGCEALGSPAAPRRAHSRAGRRHAFLDRMPPDA